MHKLFDRLANEVLPALDEFAQRVRTIGQDPAGTSGRGDGKHRRER
jgi:DNA-binding ferritin-like protein